ncbi:hypothetical protein FB451DRAFT_450878 [Mycena latifolia]|nr:hypothetical protein FB451DRAFT_450878 [Mycena latifolia]
MRLRVDWPKWRVHCRCKTRPRARPIMRALARHSASFGVRRTLAVDSLQPRPRPPTPARVATRRSGRTLRRLSPARAAPRWQSCLPTPVIVLPSQPRPRPPIPARAVTRRPPRAPTLGRLPLLERCPHRKRRLAGTCLRDRRARVATRFAPRQSSLARAWRHRPLQVLPDLRRWLSSSMEPCFSLPWSYSRRASKHLCGPPR